MRIKLTESDLKKIVKDILIEAEKTKCQTPGGIYNISISDDEVSAKVKLPKKKIRFKKKIKKNK
jgi:hypothetical protein